MTTAMLLLRIHRRSITGVALLLVVLSALQASGYAAVAGDTPEERAAFAAQSEGLSFTAMSAMVWLADARGIDFALDRTVLAAVLLVPFTVAVGAVGALWTSWRPAGAVAGLTGATVAGCFIQEVTPLYGWPDWLMNVLLSASMATLLSARSIPRR